MQLEKSRRRAVFATTQADRSNTDNLIFQKKLLGGLFEGFAAREFTRTVLAPETKIPVLGEVLCTGKAILLCGNAPVLARKIR